MLRFMLKQERKPDPKMEFRLLTHFVNVFVMTEKGRRTVTSGSKDQENMGKAGGNRSQLISALVSENTEYKIEP